MNMENVNAKVYEFLLKNGFKSFPINVFDLDSETVGFKIISYKEGREFIESLKQLDYANKHNGFAVNFNDKNYIFYSNNLTYFQRRCVVAHEIGHILLGHLTNNNHIFGKSDNQKTDNQHEIEAEAFALSFLSPIPILCEMKAYSPREICHLTELPDDLAQEVSRNISFRDPYKKTLLEEKLIEAFRDTIIEHMNIKREMFSRIAMEDLHSPKENNLKSILKSKNTFILTVFLSCILSISIWSLEQSFQNKTLSEKQVSPPPTQTQNVSHSILVPEKVEKEIPSVETVFVTSTGAKYHLQDCQYIKTKTNVSKISTTDALKIGLLPCKVCHPDEKK